MHSDEDLKRAMAELREPVPEDLERWVLELARTTPVPSNPAAFPWHWLGVVISCLPFMLVLGFRYGRQIIVETLPGILMSGLSSITNPVVGAPVLVLLVLIAVYAITSTSDTMRLRALADARN